MLDLKSQFFDFNYDNLCSGSAFVSLSTPFPRGEGGGKQGEKEHC